MKTQLPPTTDKELDTLLHLYKFRFLHTNQFQKLFGHTNPRTAQDWLKNLKDKGYITSHESQYKTRPTIFSLTKLSRKKLKNNPKCEVEELDRVYQEDSLSESFMQRYIFLADFYFNVKSQLEGQEKLLFSTQANLRGFEALPDEKIDAYIAIKDSKRTKRYFLIFIDGRKPWRVQDERIKKYLEYVDSRKWVDYSKDPLPTFLIICPNEKRKKHFYEIISNSLTDGVFYLTTKANIQYSGFKANWQKVE